MTDKANEIIESAIAALRAEAEDIEGKIAALEGALNNKTAPVAMAAPKKVAPTNGRRKRKGTKKAVTPVAAPMPSSSRDVSKTEKLKEAANKRAASWTPEKKKAAAERMRKYWAERKKAKASQG